MTELHRGLQDVLAQQHAEERECALRALLMRPLLTSGDSDFTLVRQHAQYLREWLGRETGWSLHLERECARLYKRPTVLDDATRGLPEFGRDRYVLLCLACNVLERAESQITLRALGERLLEAAADPELASRCFECTLESPRERRSLVRICRFLLEIKVLARVAGDEEAYIHHSGDVLYDIHRKILAALPASTRGASLVAATRPHLTFDERLAALTEEYVPDSAEGRRTAMRHRLARRLLDDPVTYQDEITIDEREYLASQRGPMASRLAQATGLTAELRAEGVALVDAHGMLSDEHMPAVGTEAHATLLLAEHIASRARTDSTKLHSLHELASFLCGVADRYGRYWRRDAREPGAEIGLTAQAVTRLEALKLVRRVEGAVQARPALFRYAVGAPALPERETALL